MPTAVEVLISENVNPVRRTSHLARKTIKRGQRSDMIDHDGMLCVIDGMATRIADEQNYIGGDFPRDLRGIATGTACMISPRHRAGAFTARILMLRCFTDWDARNGVD